ncbi:unnamed protein product [Diatraea saccharalis]|uniref:BTB domain-containing protein n=1 Tax=Diatraea saccharalis TaxID=40085 RepID=A0A9P0G2P2_9NEOP|nr:unnamed protein product [Diatraea saccharalis]
MRCASQSSLDESSQRPAGGEPAYDPPSAHPARLLDALCRLRQDNTLCDVVIQAQAEGGAAPGPGVAAHRAVLAAASPYFLAMFTQFEERTQPTVTIQNIEPEALEAIIEYVYTPESLEITEDNVQSLLAGASLVQVWGVRAACCAFLAAALQPDNALGIRAFADHHACADLAHAAARYIDAHAAQVLESEEFLALDTDVLCQLLDSDRITVPNEEVILDAVIRWMQHDPEKRCSSLGAALEHVRLPLLPQEVLVARAAAEPLLSAPVRVKSRCAADRIVDRSARRRSGMNQEENCLGNGRKQLKQKKSPANVDPDLRLERRSLSDLVQGFLRAPIIFETWSRSQDLVIEALSFHLSGGAARADAAARCRRARPRAGGRGGALLVVGGQAPKAIREIELLLNLKSPLLRIQKVKPDRTSVDDLPGKEKGNMGIYRMRKSGRVFVNFLPLRSPEPIYRGPVRCFIEAISEQERVITLYGTLATADGGAGAGGRGVGRVGRGRARGLAGGGPPPRAPLPRRPGAPPPRRLRHRRVQRVSTPAPIKLTSDTARTSNPSFDRTNVLRSDPIASDEEASDGHSDHEYFDGATNRPLDFRDRIGLSIVRRSLRVRSVDVYCAATDAWAPGPALCARRSTLGVAAIGDVIYAVGGFDGVTGLSSAEALDLAAAEPAWRPIASMATRRSSVGVAALGGRLYAVGGYDGASRQCLHSVERYDPATDRWEPVAAMSARRSGAGVGAVGGALYAVGGHDGPAVRRSVERLRPGAGAGEAAWAPAPPMHSQRRNAAVAAHRGKLIVVGGDDGAANLDTVEVFDPATEQWTVLSERMSVGRSYAGVCVVDWPA